MDYVLVVAGLALLLGGGEVLVRGAVALSLKLGLSPVVVGAVVMGFGTSAPELAASMSAALAGAPGIAIGNVLGSNIANILLILGLTALVMPIATHRLVSRDAGIALVASALALVGLIWIGFAGRLTGGILLLGLALYILMELRQNQVPPEIAEDALPAQPLWKGALMAVVGIAVLIAGAHLLVQGAVAIATDLGVPEAIIGVTLVAVGTSLPELAASMVAAFRRQGALALGNILGSNVFNVFGILGLTALVVPLPVPVEFDWVEMVAVLASTAAFLGFAAMGRFGRVAGLALLAGYGVYLAVILG